MATRSIAPRADGEGKLGTSDLRWGEVNAVKISGNLTGDVDGSATKLTTARTVALTGDVTASGTFDGSADLSLATKIALLDGADGAAIANSVYKNEQVTGATLHANIANNFSGVKMGQYVTLSSVKVDGTAYTLYVKVVDADPFYDTSAQYAKISTHHVGAIVLGLPNHVMRSTDTTAGGYYGTETNSDGMQYWLKNSVLPNLKTALTSAGLTVLKHQCLLSTAVGTSLYNRFGSATGASSSWAWHDEEICLMSSVQVTGDSTMSSSFYDIGEANRQMSAFKLKTWYTVVNQHGGSNKYFWLRDVSSSSCFGIANGNGGGVHGSYGASYASFVVPLILLS